MGSSTMLLKSFAVLALLVSSAMADWSRGTATFYGGKDGSGTMRTHLSARSRPQLPLTIELIT